MDSGAKALIIGAVITTVGGVIVAIISRSDQSTNGGGNVPSTACPQIPPTNAASRAKAGYVWVPDDWKVVAGRFEPISGHWERERAARSRYVAGHWDPSASTCSWIPGRFVSE